MPINAEVVCVPPTLGISHCQGDINKAGCALSSALKHLLSPVDCLLRALHVHPGKRWRTLHRTLQSLTHSFQSPSDHWHCFSLCLTFTSKKIYLSLLNWSKSFISHSIGSHYNSSATTDWVELKKQTSPPQSQPDAQSFVFSFSFFFFFSLCQTAYGEINWWAHAGNRVAIETSHIRLGLEFVTGEKTGEQGRQRGGSLERWSHSLHNINAEFTCSASSLPYPLKSSSHPAADLAGIPERKLFFRLQQTFIFWLWDW